MDPSIKNAVILVAGLGIRLKPLTNEVPKCLTEINNKPILKNTLELLDKNGFEQAVIVIGYLGNKIKEAIGQKFGNMDIIYIENPIYKDTNSMYSTWLARKYLEKGVLLIEGDTIFEEDIIKKALETDSDKSFWIVDRFTEQFDGCMSTVDENDRIIKVEIIRKKLKEYKENFFKSTGMVKVTFDYGKAFSKWLDDDVKAGNVKVYYDLVLAKHIHEKPLYVYNIDGLKWFEIDDLEDLRKAERIFQPMKYVIVIMDGAADLPLEELQGRTPLEAANIPNIDHLTKNGKTGLLQTMYPGLPVGSIVANMGILGYNPARYYPVGRASFEALAQDIFLNDDDVAFRCNLISIEDGKIKDFTAGMISNDDALNIIDNLKIDNQDIEVYSGQSYRNLLIVRNADFLARGVNAFEPHNNIGEELKSKLLKADNDKIKSSVERLNSIILDSIEQIKRLNKKYNTKADMIWLWSPSTTPSMPSFHSKYGINGAIVAGLDFMRGIGVAARMETKEIHGATGYFNTNLKEKLKYAKNFLRYNDMVYIHVNAPDEESHAHNIKNKIKSIENIDNEIVGPILQFLNENYSSNFRIVVMPDHYTLIKNGKHDERSVPYVVYGKGIKEDSIKKFTEKDISKADRNILKSYEFMNFFIGLK